MVLWTLFHPLPPIDLEKLHLYAFSPVGDHGPEPLQLPGSVYAPCSWDLLQYTLNAASTGDGRPPELNVQLNWTEWTSNWTNLTFESIGTWLNWTELTFQSKLEGRELTWTEPKPWTLNYRVSKVHELFLVATITMSVSCKSSRDSFNPRLTGLQIYHHLQGGGRGCSNTPRLSRLLLIVEKNEKQCSKAHQKWSRNYFSKFFAKVKIVAPMAKNGEIFEFFAIVKDRFGKPPVSLELLQLRKIPKRHSKEH